MPLLRQILSNTGAGAPFQQVVAKTEGVAEGGASIFEPNQGQRTPQVLERAKLSLRLSSPTPSNHLPPSGGSNSARAASQQQAGAG